MDKTTYELPWTGEQTQELIGKINTIENTLSTSIFKKPDYAGKVAVFDGNGDLTYASESAYIPSSKYLGYQDFQYLATASATTGVPLVENFSIDSTPISAAAGIQRIKTNQVLTGQIVANNNATVDNFSTGPSIDTIKFQKINGGTVTKPIYEDMGYIDPNGIHVPHIWIQNGSSELELRQPRTINTTVTFSREYNNKGLKKDIWGRPQVFYWRYGDIVIAHVKWMGTCNEPVYGGYKYYKPVTVTDNKETKLNETDAIPLGFRPADTKSHIFVSYVGVNWNLLSNNVIGCWYFSPDGKFGGTTNNSGGYERYASTMWYTNDTFPGDVEQNNK